MVSMYIKVKVANSLNSEKSEEADLLVDSVPFLLQYLMKF